MSCRSGATLSGAVPEQRTGRGACAGSSAVAGPDQLALTSPAREANAGRVTSVQVGGPVCICDAGQAVLPARARACSKLCASSGSHQSAAVARGSACARHLAARRRASRAMAASEEPLARVGSSGKRGIFPGNYGARLNHWEERAKSASCLRQRSPPRRTGTQLTVYKILRAVAQAPRCRLYAPKFNRRLRRPSRAGARKTVCRTHAHARQPTPRLTPVPRTRPTPRRRRRRPSPRRPALWAARPQRRARARGAASTCLRRRGRARPGAARGLTRRSAADGRPSRRQLTARAPADAARPAS